MEDEHGDDGVAQGLVVEKEQLFCRGLSSLEADQIVEPRTNNEHGRGNDRKYQAEVEVERYPEADRTSHRYVEVDAL